MILVVVATLGLTGLASPLRAQPSETSPDNAASQKSSADSRASQKTSTTAWIIQRTSLAQTRRADFHDGLRDALGTHSGQHLVGREGLAARLGERPATVPPCLFGVEDCGSALSAALEHLAIDTVVRLEVDAADDGDASDTIRARYTLVDRTGESRRTATVNAEGVRNLAFAIVGDIFDATATIQVDSTPSGANVFVDDEKIGTTPLEQRIGIGRHSYRVELADHDTASGDIELTADSTETIEVELTPRPATLDVRGAPDGATVDIDGEQRGTVSEPIEISPGAHSLTVRAEGFKPLERNVEAKPGQSLQLTAPLEPESRWLKDIETDAIASNRYILRVSGSMGLLPTTYRDSRTRIEGGELEFSGFLNDNQNRPVSETIRRTAVPFGAQVDFGYSGRNLGLILASMSYSGASMNKKAELTRRTDTRESVTATVEGVRRFQLRPLQIRYRHFFKNFAPTIEAGTGISFQWIAVRPDDTDRREVLKQTEAFWTIGAGAQYFFTPRIFILGRYNVQDFFNAGRGVEHVLNIGAGLTFPDLFGFEPRPPERLE